MARHQLPVELVPKVNDVVAEEGGLSRRGFKEEVGAQLVWRLAQIWTDAKAGLQVGLSMSTGWG